MLCDVFDEESLLFGDGTVNDLDIFGDSVGGVRITGLVTGGGCG